MKIKILMIYIEPTPYIMGLIEELHRSWAGKIEVLFLTENTTQPWGIKLPDYCKVLPGIGLHSVLILRSRIQSGGYSMLHLAGWGHPKLLIAMLMGWLSRIPVFVESDTQTPFQISPIKRLIKRLIFPWLFKIPHGFLPGGSRQAQYLRFYGVADKKIHIAQMTVDGTAITAYAKRFMPKQRDEFRAHYEFGLDDIVFIYVGRLEPYKCIEQLLHTFQKIALDHSTAKLLLVGDGTLMAIASQWAQTKNFLATAGRLDGEQLLAAYCSADVFVLPSEFESWGLVVNEAMAAGLPVIASNRVGCVDDLIDGKDTGVVYDFDDPDGLLLSLELMLLDAPKRRQFGENALSLIHGWSLAEEADRVMKAWESIG